ncbi:MAG: hypothetical protein HRT72_00860 [Flavobacteriales bacterium]|nr:hypothetical protein [Flavobacteriales bacterium]
MLLTDVDHSYYTIEVKTTNNTFAIEDLSVAPTEIAWSASGEVILVHEKDFYANE